MTEWLNKQRTDYYIICTSLHLVCTVLHSLVTPAEWCTFSSFLIVFQRKQIRRQPAERCALINQSIVRLPQQFPDSATKAGLAQYYAQNSCIMHNSMSSDGICSNY